jgi:hypothetical protein
MTTSFLSRQSSPEEHMLGENATGHTHVQGRQGREAPA